ncbi:MAG: choice-of-anchor tandem repeat GloVer-containing protein, partial [Terriglobia bacterium]
MPLRKVRIYGPWVLTMVLLIVATGVPAARAQTYTDLFNFDGTHGAGPSNPGILAQGRDGSLYGTAPSGGSQGGGVAFRVTVGGTPRVMHDFATRPDSGLTLGEDGDFYGTTVLGGSNGDGTVFKITSNGTLTTLYSFTSADPQPQAPPI